MTPGAGWGGQSVDIVHTLILILDEVLGDVKVLANLK